MGGFQYYKSAAFPFVNLEISKKSVREVVFFSLLNFSLNFEISFVNIEVRFFFPFQISFLDLEYKLECHTTRTTDSMAG